MFGQALSLFGLPNQPTRARVAGRRYSRSSVRRGLGRPGERRRSVTLMEIALTAAPHIDRLVLSVARQVDIDHGAYLSGLALEGGLDTLDLIPHFADFLLGGVLTRELAVVRVRYRPSEQVLARLDELAENRLIRQAGSGLVATSALRPLLEALHWAQAEVAAKIWESHADDVAAAASIARTVAHAASTDHTVATVHRSLPEPVDPYLLLHHRLVTLRFIRQHDHAVAWLQHGLTAAEMVIVTSLWQAGRVAQPSGFGRLIELGLVETDPPRLTDRGRELRGAIEAETNRRAQQTFDLLDDEVARDFLAALQRLPGQIH